MLKLAILIQAKDKANDIWKLQTYMLCLVTQMVNNLSPLPEMEVQFLGWEDPLEKGTATHSSILAREIPWTEGPGWLQSVGSEWVGHSWATNTFTFKDKHVRYECSYQSYGPDILKSVLFYTYIFHTYICKTPHNTQQHQILKQFRILKAQSGFYKHEIFSVLVSI